MGGTRYRNRIVSANSADKRQHYGNVYDCVHRYQPRFCLLEQAL
jgi:hypothetical protein